MAQVRDRRVAALGFRAHSGWTAATAVGGSPGNPAVRERRRIETADPAIPGSKQPYHAAERLELKQAEALIQKCRESSTGLARDAVSAMIAQLQAQGYELVGAGILYGQGRPLPGLAATLQSHALLHAAEGEFFREVMARASEACSLPVAKVKERDIWDRGAAMFHLSAAELQERINELGRSLGPPWRRDEKLASMAAWIALGCRE